MPGKLRTMHAWVVQRHGSPGVARASARPSSSFSLTSKLSKSDQLLTTHPSPSTVKRDPLLPGHEREGLQRLHTTFSGCPVPGKPCATDVSPSESKQNKTVRTELEHNKTVRIESEYNQTVRSELEHNETVRTKSGHNKTVRTRIWS